MKSLTQSELFQISGGCFCEQNFNWYGVISGGSIGLVTGFLFGYGIATPLMLGVSERLILGCGLGLIWMVGGAIIGGHRE